MYLLGLDIGSSSIKAAIVDSATQLPIHRGQNKTPICGGPMQKRLLANVLKLQRFQ